MMTFDELKCESPQLGIRLDDGRMSFMDLSPEIRNMIYDYVLDEAAKKIVIKLQAGMIHEWTDQLQYQGFQERPKGLKSLPLGLSLFITNTQIWKEANLMIFSKLPFLVDHIPLIRKPEVADGNVLRTNLEYKEGLLKRLTEGEYGLPLTKLNLVTRLEFKAAMDFHNFLKLEADFDKLRGTAGQSKHNLLGKIFKGVETVVVQSPYNKSWPPLKFGVIQWIWNADLPEKLRHTFPSLETLIVNEPRWQEVHVVTRET